MTNRRLVGDSFSDVNNLDDAIWRPGVYVPYDICLMYPSGRLP